MAEFDIQGKITFDSTQAQAALGQTATAADKTAASTAKVGEAAKASVPQIGQFGSTLGLAGQAVGKLSPQMGGLVTLVGTATGAMQSLMTAGLGPVGIAIGAVSVAISAATALWNSQEEAIKRNETALREYDKIQSEIASRRRQEALDAELENVDSEYYHSEEGRRARAQANWEAAYQRTREADLRTMALLAEGLPEQQDRPRGGGRRAAAEAAAITEDPNAAAGASLSEMDRLWAQSEERLRIRREEWDRQAAGEREFQELLRQIEEDDYLDQLDRNREYLEAREAQEAEAADKLTAINDAVFSALESAFSNSVAAWLDGSKSIGDAARDMVRDVARSLTNEAIVQGLKETAMGISALAVGSPSAAVHFAAAGKWAAVGVAAGVAGAASGAFGGGGGGGGAPAAATGGPALTPGTAEGAGSTVVINWGSSGLVYAADRAQLGRDISGMISEAHGRLGRGA